MSDDLPVYRVVAASGTQQTQAVRGVLCGGKDGHLFILRLPNQNTPGGDASGCSYEDALILECLGRDNVNAMDALRQFVRHSPLAFYVNPADIETAAIEGGDDSPGKVLQDYVADSAAYTPPSQCVISNCNDCKHYEKLARKHESIRAESENLRVLSEMLREGILVVDNDGLILYVNPAACRLFERPAEQLVGSPFGFPIADGDSEITLLRPGGSECIVEMRTSSITRNGEAVILASLRDVTEQKREQHELEYVATHDGLTGLYNHRTFHVMLEDELQRSQRHKHAFSLLMLDVDHFKQINDTYGHQAGDAILRGLGTLLMAQVRNIDRICRYGGEEIMVILPETRVEGAMEIAERILKAVEAQEFDVGEDSPKFITISIGVASHPLHAKTVHDFVRAVDTALYVSKENGRNRISLAAT